MVFHFSEYIFFLLVHIFTHYHIWHVFVSPVLRSSYSPLGFEQLNDQTMQVFIKTVSPSILHKTAKLSSIAAGDSFLIFNRLCGTVATSKSYVYRSMCHISI